MAGQGHRNLGQAASAKVIEHVTECFPESFNVRLQSFNPPNN